MSRNGRQGTDLDPGPLQVAQARHTEALDALRSSVQKMREENLTPVEVPSKLLLDLVKAVLEHHGPDHCEPCQKLYGLLFKRV